VTVNTLREMLEDLDGDIEVRLMTQESWPFEYDIKGTILATDTPNDENHFNPPFKPAEPNSTDEAFYIVEGNQLGYGSKGAWTDCTER